MKNTICVTLLIGVASAALTRCAFADETGDTSQQASNWRTALIPQPLSMETEPAWFTLRPDMKIDCDAPAEPVAKYLAGLMKQWMGATPEVRKFTGKAPESGIVLATDAGNAELGDEGYTLTINNEGVRLRANTPQGLARGVQTLRQWHGRISPNPSLSAVSAPRIQHVRIIDHPRYRWRGMHLDVGRHFMPLEFVKEYIDLLAYHKMNIFHWHLTEDQGWRIEIQKYPKLTEVAAWRMDDGQRYGGFYTQDEVREVLAYAAERYVTVVPEIEMPGHTMAALAAYPELSCTGGPFEISGKSGIREEVYCAGNDEVFVFLENILDEVCKLFPSPYIHIGGDECPKKRWQKCAKCQARIKSEGLADEHALQSYFIRRIEKMLNARGKNLVGWDEILEGGLAPNATVMSWRGTKGGIEAARQGHDVIMCPTSHCYFDYRQSDREGERGAPWAPVIDLATVYQFEPTPAELNGAEARHVLGGQGNIWTERMLTPEDVEYMAYPRTCALAEVLWSAPQRRDWDDFRARLDIHLRRLDDMQVNYRRVDEK